VGDSLDRTLYVIAKKFNEFKKLFFRVPLLFTGKWAGNGLMLRVGQMLCSSRLTTGADNPQKISLAELSQALHNVQRPIMTKPAPVA